MARRRRRSTRINRALTEYARDDSFRLSNIVFLVEDCLFSVNGKPFETHSEVFSNMFSLPQGDGEGATEGANEEHPIRLDGITLDEFRDFLTVMNAPLYLGNVILSEEAWMRVLKLSHMWSFNEIKSLAVSGLHSFERSPMQTITIARQFDIEEWIEPAVRRLAEREWPLTDEEVNRIGLRDAFRITRARETRLSDHLKVHLNQSDQCKSGHIVRVHAPRCRKEMSHWNHIKCGDPILSVSENCPFCKLLNDEGRE